jgi:hypothetical protein
LADNNKDRLFSAARVIGVSNSNFEAIPGWEWNKIELVPDPTPTWEFRSDTNGTRLRFPLRTLLIATTLVAVVLGLIVWAAR